MPGLHCWRLLARHCVCIRSPLRRSVLVVCGAFLLFGIQGVSAQESRNPAEIAANLHHPDAAIRTDAQQQVRALGISLSPSQMELGSKLVDPDPRLRLILATEAYLAQDLSTQDILLQLTFHDDPRIRQLVVRAMSEESPDGTLRDRLIQLATFDPHPVVIAQARLALADWGMDVDQPKPASSAPKEIASAGNMAVPAAVPDSRSEQTGSVRPASFDSKTKTDDELRNVHTESIKTAELWQEPSTSGHSGLSFAVVPLERAGEPTDAMNSPLFVPSPEIGFQTESDSTSNAESETSSSLRPEVLQRPLIEPNDVFPDPSFEEPDDYLLAYPVEAPLGYSGPSGVLPEDYQKDGHFVPMEDRWRSGFPDWDRYDKDHPPVDDYPYVKGHWWDPYNQNVLKGDYPVIGQHTFFKLEAEALMVHEYRQLPIPTTPFESTVDPFQEEFFGDPNQYFTTNFLKVSFELFHGNAGFKPFDWLVRLTPVFNINYLSVQELGVVNPDVRRGTSRQDDFVALQEWFAEAKLADLSPDYDFVSIRAGQQPFTSDFRGFIFDDINRGVRLFGTRLANRDQFNLIFFDQTEKDTNSQLNTFFDDRNQNTLIANYYRQDFLYPGYTAQASIHYNRDGPDFQFDNNDFLARPDPAGSFKPHEVEAVYLGLAGEGHIGFLNISNAFYWALGEDSLNPIAGQAQDINAQMAALELSFDRDWVRFRSSFFYSSGDKDPYDRDAEGFDSILDNPNFAGGEFSFWQRQEIRLFGVGLVNRLSLVPDMRSSKFQGQSNFVNPGLILLNLGMDFEITPKLKLITNANYLEFDDTAVLEAFTFQDDIDETIGVDLSLGAEYRPLLSDNVVIEAGYAALIPGRGFKDLYGRTVPFTTANAHNIEADTLHAAFMQMILLY
ncbi:MAG: HEAT repeat domain-containing protein [Planctomycetaceae bacterium]|nr:HEAT repeat domain-containing protein [Planctomycetaceae bacterium]